MDYPPALLLESAEMPVEQPNFATASDDDMKRYLRGLWQWLDESDIHRNMRNIKDAEQELIRRGHSDYVDYLRII